MKFSIFFHTNFDVKLTSEMLVERWSGQAGSGGLRFIDIREWSGQVGSDLLILGNGRVRWGSGLLILGNGRVRWAQIY